MTQADRVHSTPPTNTSPLPPGLPAQQQTRQEAVETLRSLRKQARAEIDRLIRFLDASDLDPDVEENGDDQDQSYPEYPASRGCECPFEDAANDVTETEPSLGSIESHPSGYTTQAELDGRHDQTRWASSGTDDCEDEHDGREDGGDDEPDPSGIADLDGLMEQCPAMFSHRKQRVQA